MDTIANGTIIDRRRGQLRLGRLRTDLSTGMRWL